MIKGGGGGGVQLDFVIKLDLEIAVKQRTRRYDQISTWS